MIFVTTEVKAVPAEVRAAHHIMKTDLNMTENDPTPDSANSDIKSLFLTRYLISTWTETAYFVYVFIYNIFKLYITHLNDNKAGKSPSTVVNRNKLIGKTPTI